MPRCPPSVTTEEIQPQSEPTRIAAYRRDGSVRRCRTCAHVLSIVARGDLCGRCVLQSGKANPAVDPEGVRPDALVRGQVLVALDRRRYPRLTLGDGRSIGPGLDAWGPVLLGMGLSELSDLLDRVLESGQ